MTQATPERSAEDVDRGNARKDASQWATLKQWMDSVGKVWAALSGIGNGIVALIMPFWLFPEAYVSTRWITLSLGFIGVVFGLLWGAARTYGLDPQQRAAKVTRPFIWFLVCGVLFTGLRSVMDATAVRTYPILEPLYVLMASFSWVTDFIVGTTFGACLAGLAAIATTLTPKGHAAGR